MSPINLTLGNWPKGNWLEDLRFEIFEITRPTVGVKSMQLARHTWCAGCIYILKY